jgi:hypothetical protein
MKPAVRFAIALLLLLPLYTALAQAPLVLEPAVVRKQITVSPGGTVYEEMGKVSVRNTTNRQLRVRWDKVIIRLPMGWEVYVCDNNASYPPQTNTNYDPLRGINAPMVIEAGGSVDLYIHFQSPGKAGEATVELPLRLIGGASGEIVQRAVFHIKIEEQSQVSAPVLPVVRPAAPTGIRIFPNPVEDRFYISNAPPLARVDLHNAIGRKIRSFDRPDVNLGLDVSDLPEGVYLVSLIDERGKTLRTLRMVRRGFRP